jgi:RHS repeat-associated protein
MKRIIKSLLPACVLLIAHPGFAQQVSNPVSNVPQSPPVVTPTVLVYPNLEDFGALYYNFVRTQVPDVPVQTWPTSEIYSRQSTQYYDGLGRPLQAVAKKAHADGYDIIQHKVYDAAGREAYSYLPYTLPASMSTGKCDRRPKTHTHNFYDQAGPDEQPYSKIEYDNSPLNKVTKQLAPGKSWVGSNRGVKYEYRSNEANEVRIWTIGNTADAIPVSILSYAANELSIITVTDEDNKFSMEYKDKMGKLILKKTFDYDNHQGLTGHNGYACTYYVYDDMQKLRYVIPPKAVEAINGTWNVAVVPELCFSYCYDERGRTVEKKIPGKAAEYFVYDKRDRQVLYQDGDMRAQAKWQFTFYDALDRPTVNGLINSSQPRTAMVNDMQSNTVYANTEWQYYAKNYNLYQAYPSSINNGNILSYTYYDNYDPLQGFSYDGNQFSSITLPANNTVVPSVLTNAVKGMATGSKVKVMDPDNAGANNWLTSVNYYDDKGRLIQTQSQNLKGGLDISSNIYYFQGMIWKNIVRHQSPSALPVPGVTDGAINEIAVVKTFERNLAIGGGSDQVYKVTQKIGNGVVYDLAYYEYDHLGRVTVKQFTAANVLQEYNIRGFLNHIKAANFNNNPASNQLEPHIFEENLYYDKGFTSKLYNGNIAGITWKKAGSQAPVEAYGYSYDQLNRLNHAEYRRTPYNTTNWQKTTHDYTASNITYDLNGNIQSMDQRSVNPPAINMPINMDQLSYTYTPNSNKLVKVKDNITASVTTGLPDFKDNADLAEEYLYDPNGNMTTDRNKGISAITYSYLNKPEKITVTGQGIITYVYDAAGNRLQKKVLNTTNNTTGVYDYIGNFVYKDNVLQYILNEEGRTRPIPIEVANTNGAEFTTKFVYDYFVKDHLGNVRSTVTAKPIDNIYLAKHEIASANTEQLLFDNIPNVRDNKPGSTAINDGMAAKLNGSSPDRRIGTAIMLHTMPGDRFNISADAYYEGEYEQSNETSTEDVISSLMGALTGGTTYAGIPLKELPDNIRTVAGVLGNPQLPGQLNELLNNNNNPNAPKAHLNYLFFNEKLELLPGNSGMIQVPLNPMGWTTISPSMITGANATAVNGTVSTLQPGYVIIYIDNQSIGKDVWFDNLMVGHYKGEVIEENHYYPMGLTLAVAEAPNVTKNPLKLTTKELESSFGLGMYDFGARTFDMTGRGWGQVDPLAEKHPNQSPYLFCNGNPILYMDPDGRDGIVTIKGSQINVTSNVYVYGAGATKAVVSQMQSDVNSRWGGTYSAKTSDGKTSFNVNANISIGLYEGKEKNDPFIIEESWNPNNRDNFVEIGAKDKRSYVSGGDEGEWRSQGRNGLTLAQDDPAPHEVGHLLGLDDRYTDKNGPNKGWENNIMGSSQNGKVEQRNIDGIIQDAMKAYESWSKDKNNAGKEFKYEIDTNKPNKENH